ncbi:Oidioi.mRNA.OKI2018_I69.PAR.g10806.t1.cds [Oikopleura dioica]|uniref:Oidioi.mRNA.OKI2018_I69.PAR.g10806.t1.cds n=1 Tax=Oikopleura dioica TaxID=34765 RepID=A0ABN7RTC0_OIKDI|nr:Oidioi.mRNA.OKI2018_I69.PAR.g10806.t1.cds [Oikopleura dioica]
MSKDTNEEMNKAHSGDVFMKPLQEGKPKDVPVEEIIVQFEDDAKSYKIDFLCKTFPYFKTLFDFELSNKSDSSMIKYSLPMKKCLFECFHDKHEKDIEWAPRFLEKLEELKDGSEEFPDMVRRAMIFLQIDEYMVSAKDEDDDFLGHTLADYKDAVEAEWDGNGEPHDKCPVKYLYSVRGFLMLRYFHRNIFNVPDREDRDYRDWWEFDIPDIIPEVPEKYAWVMYHGGNYGLFVFFTESMIWDDHFGDEDACVKDEEIEFCFAQEIRVDYNHRPSGEFYIQEYGINELRAKEGRSDSKFALYSFWNLGEPLEIIQMEYGKRYKVTINVYLERKDVFVDVDGTKNMGPWLEVEDEEGLSFEITFPGHRCIPFEL